jgi:LAO/AO transport system kinase
MTDTMVREVRSVIALSHDPDGWNVPILRTEAAKGEGVPELAEKIDEHRAFIEACGVLEERRAHNLRNEVLGIASSRMRRRLEAIAAEDPETAALLDRVVRRELDPASAASELLERQDDEDG